MNRLDAYEGSRSAQSPAGAEPVRTEAVREEAPRAEVVYKRMHYGNTIPDGRMLVFLTGFCLGMVFFYLSGGIKGNGDFISGLFSIDSFSQIKNFLAYKGGLLEYIFGVRLGQFVFVLLCATSTLGAVLAYGVLGWCGFEFALLVFTAVYQYGVSGLLLSVLLFFPHGIFYALMLLLVFNKAWRADRGRNRGNPVRTRGGLAVRLTGLRNFLIALMIFLLGVLSETYVNPEILKRFALFF
ncbi:MAG: hypothetical protein NC337_11785 [Roseburia sp.]|nr:hypothetical protein [Roseburia sp.]